MDKLYKGRDENHYKFVYKSVHWEPRKLIILGLIKIGENVTIDVDDGTEKKCY
jgi:hypothetical protein